jgi:acetylglutamate kinase
MTTIKQQCIVVKIGGNLLDNAPDLEQFLDSFAALPSPKILVHGGGKLATELSAKLDIPTQMVEGRRVTNAETLKVVAMVYGGLINKSLVAALQHRRCDALGVMGADAALVQAHKRRSVMDYGFVGDIDAVNIPKIQELFAVGLSLVVAPLTADTDTGTLLNTNADTMASAIASALSEVYEVHCWYCFEKHGVLASVDDEDSVIPVLTFEHYQTLKANGVVVRGMIPKLDAAFSALRSGVQSVRVCHASVLSVHTDNTGNKGTVLVIP